jgi:hypothetical protein
MKMKLNSFLFSIFLSVDLFSVLLVKDVSNDLNNQKSYAQQVKSSAQQVKTYGELKKTLTEMKKQTDMLNKQLESFNGVRTSISSVKKDIYEEVNFWRDSVDSLQESMTKLHKTVVSTQDNFNKMVDLSDGNYYNGTFNNDDAEAIIKKIKKKLKVAASGESEELLRVAIKKDTSSGDIKDKTEGYKFIASARRSNVDKFKRDWGNAVTGEMWVKQLETGTKKAQADLNSTLNYFKELKVQIDTRMDIYGQTQLTNIMLNRLLEIAQENILSAKKFRTAMLAHYYTLSNNKAFAVQAGRYVVESGRIDKMKKKLKRQKWKNNGKPNISLIEIMGGKASSSSSSGDTRSTSDYGD